MTTIEEAKNRRRQRRQLIFRRMLPWLLVLPLISISITVMIGPAISSFYYAMTEWSGFGAAHFIGLENFRLLLEDSSYKEALLHNLLWLIYVTTIPIAMALVVASLLAPLRRFGMFFRTAFFIPYVLASVVISNVWRNLLSPTKGIGALLAKVGVPGLDQAYLGNPKTSLFAIFFIDNWHWWGFLMVLFLAAMQNISPDLYEAARIEGANRWHEFRYITIPGIRSTLFLMLLMTSIWSFLVFDYVWILTEGGPAGGSEVLGTLLFKNAFFRFEAGYAAAIGLTMSFYGGIFILLFIFGRRRGWDI